MNSPENKIALQEYIDNNNDKCETSETVPILLKGHREILPVYKIPLNYLFFNIKNGRFKAEYVELVRKNGGKELDPTTHEDANKIQDLLLDLDPIETKRTTLDIRQRGQWNPGIMTHDGFVIDGNRRLSILRRLAKEDSTFNVMKIARLPRAIDKNDLWKLEAGIQLGKDEIVKYGPINELLKLKEGVDAGLSEVEIADALYGQDKKEISKKLRRLKLIEDYLEFNGTPKKYNEVKNKAEQFIDAQNILEHWYEWIDDLILKKSIKRAIWELIRTNQSHWEIRKVRDMLKISADKALNWVKKIAEESTPIDGSKKPSIDQNDKVTTMWSNALDALNVKKNEKDSPRLLRIAAENLETIDYDDEQLKTTQCREWIRKILRHADNLKGKSGLE